MDWLHCNRCFRTEAARLCVSSCGHTCCQSCASPEKCGVCGAPCKYLLLSDKMKAQEQVYFRDTVELTQNRLEHLTQISLFQKTQMVRVLSFFKRKSSELERRLEEVCKASHREISELRKENSELKRLLSQRGASPGPLQSNRCDQQSRPVAITSPVTPRQSSCPVSRSNSIESLERYRATRSAHTTPAFNISLSRHSTPTEPAFRTPNNSAVSGVVYRSVSLTPSAFQIGPLLGLQSPVLRGATRSAPSSHYTRDTPVYN